MSQKKIYTYKVVVAGDASVGKTSMIQRLITGKFLPLKKTVGAEISTFNFKVDEFIKVRLQIWDFAGEERFRFFLPSYIRGTDGCILCYDISRESSFKDLREWYDIAVRNAKNPVFALVGCKQDLSELHGKIDSTRARKFQEKFDIPLFFETSSLTGQNNSLIFKELSNMIYKRMKSEKEI